MDAPLATPYNKRREEGNDTPGHDRHHLNIDANGVPYQGFDEDCSERFGKGVVQKGLTPFRNHYLG